MNRYLSPLSQRPGAATSVLPARRFGIHPGLWLLPLAVWVASSGRPELRGQDFLPLGQVPPVVGEEVSLASASETQPAFDRCVCGCAAGRPCIQATGWSGGIDFLWVRPHFSEAVAFARGNQSPTSYQTVAEELEFDHDSSVRASVGYRLADGNGSLRLSYWHLDGDTSVGATAGGPGQFIVDPFGNLVGAVAVIDPADARFGAVLAGGAAIATQATVTVNIYDLDFARAYRPSRLPWDLEWSIGVRLADVDQFYESIVTDAGGSVLSRGEFLADFTGAGPRVGVESRRYFGGHGAFSLFANSHMALLLGQYDVRGDNMPVPGFHAMQSESMTRTVPVFETELGVSRQVHGAVHLSLGWLFQAWIDLGTSGGTFGGFFAGADDANIMSFDGLFARAEFFF